MARITSSKVLVLVSDAVPDFFASLYSFVAFFALLKRIFLSTRDKLLNSRMASMVTASSNTGSLATVVVPAAVDLLEGSVSEEDACKAPVQKMPNAKIMMIFFITSLFFGLRIKILVRTIAGERIQILKQG